MIDCKILIKIKDYFPKTKAIPYQHYICHFISGVYEAQLPFLPNESKYIEHNFKNITSDIKYKIHVLNSHNMGLIGICDLNIQYDIMNKIIPQNGFIKEEQKKLNIDSTTKRKIFGTLIKSGDIYLNIYSEVIILSKKSLEHKNINRKIVYNPQCYVKYNFHLKESALSPTNKIRSPIITNNINNNNNKDCNWKNSKYNEHYRKINPKKELNNKELIINYINKNKTTNNSSKNTKSADIVEKKPFNNSKIKTSDFLQGNIYNENNYINDNDLLNQKKGYMTEQNFNPNQNIKIEYNYFPNNNKNQIYSKKKNYSIGKNKIKIRDYTNNDTEDECLILNKNEYSNSPKIFSPNLNRIIKGKELNINIPDDNQLNNKQKIQKKFIYETKSKIEKISKANKNNKSNNNSNIQYNNQNNSITSEDNSNIYPFSNNTNLNTENINMSLFSPSSSSEEDYNDIEKKIIEKGYELRNDFQNQLEQNKMNKFYSPKTENISMNKRLKGKNDKFKKNYNNNNNTHSSNIEKMSEYSSTQSLENSLTQEKIKSNCLNLIEFYSLLNTKIKNVKREYQERKDKLIFFKEIKSNNIKIQNQLDIKNEYKNFSYFSTKNINEPINQKLLEIFPKIKISENDIHKTLFNVQYTKDYFIKFRDNENYQTQAKLFLLLTIIKNLINKYGNISQIFDKDINKKKKLKKCLLKNDLREKEKGEVNYINLEDVINEITKMKNEKKKKELESKNNDNFKVINEVDEDENEEENEEEIKNENSNKDINDINLEENNKIKNDSINNNEKDEEELIDKMLIDELRKKDTNNQFNFEKIGKNEYVYDNIKFNAIIDENKNINIIMNQNKYIFDDFIKFLNDKYNHEEEINNEEKNNNVNDNEENKEEEEKKEKES